MTTFHIKDAAQLPLWRRPISLLFLMAAAMPIAFSVWSALLNNFVIEVADFDGSDIGLLHTIREIPGFLAIGVIYVIIFMREQTLGWVSLLLLGISTAVTAQFPEMAGILTVTLLSSIGFHYYETVNQSLQLQWIEKERAPFVLGKIMGVGYGITFLAYLMIDQTWDRFSLSFTLVYWVAGSITAAIAIFCWLAYPKFEGHTVQRKEIVLRKRYWLYYALQFMSGARRQIFVVFAGFMLVERFGYSVDDMMDLLMINLIVSTVAAPLIGKVVSIVGERRMLVVEYIGLTLVFVAYGAVYAFGWGAVIATSLYVINHVFFAMALALKTYFQKIADPADIAPTAAVAFTINHIAAVFLPVGLGLLWLWSPMWVFVAAAGMAAISLCLALLIPRNPEPGRETIFQ